MANINHQENQAEVAVVMVPFTAQGHINQLLHLSRLISAYNIPIHFITTTTHGHKAKLRLHGWDPLSDPTIHFHDIQPDPTASSFNSTFKLRQSVAEILLQISITAKKIVLIHDSLMTYVVQDVATLPNAESYLFRALSAFFLFWQNWERLGRPFEVEPEIQAHSPNIQGCYSPEFVEYLKIQASYQNFHSGIILDTSRVIEGQYIDLLDHEAITGKPKIWGLGPFNPVEVPVFKDNRHRCLEWLDKQETNSVIYVSFGTSTSLSDEQIRELANGLQKSQQKFLWVLRDADRGDVVGEVQIQRVGLPKEYEERVKGEGIVVRDWAPQIEILGHPSTGAFMTHCGWNSSMESFTAGVPMATWPMHTDQPGNAVLITQVLRVGLAVKNWGERDVIISSSSIAHIVRRLMSSQEGKEIRERAKELSESIKNSIAAGGATRLELDSFISQIKR